MRVEVIGTKGTWREVANSANTTVAKEAGTKEPSDQWKRRMLLCEHSPIRQLIYKWKWYDLKYWVSVHLVRHWLGIVHWVRSQRSDRTGVQRDDLPQGSLVEHECEANAQALINISRKRLCFLASSETRAAWVEVVQSLPLEMGDVCRPDCIYRGYCYEFKSCGYHKTEAFQQELLRYRRGINE